MRFPHTLCLIVICACQYGLNGCIPMSGQQGPDLSKLDQFQIEKNKTTEKELVDHFGPPMNTSARSDGTRMLSWSDVRSAGHQNLAAGLPVVGLFTNHVDLDTKRKTFTATVRNGVVVDFVTSEGNGKLAY